jgi:putative endonuclease
MMASKRNGTIYVGVTSDLVKRVWQHRTGAADGFTKRYECKQLVWFEPHDAMKCDPARKAAERWQPSEKDGAD